MQVKTYEAPWWAFFEITTSQRWALLFEVLFSSLLTTSTVMDQPWVGSKKVTGPAFGSRIADFVSNDRFVFLFQRFQVFPTLSFFGWSEQLLDSDCSHFSGFSTPVQVQPKTSAWFIFAAVPVWVSSRSGGSRAQNKTGCGRKVGEFRSRSRLQSSKWRSLDTREC